MIGIGALGYCYLTLTADSYVYSCIVLYQSQQDAYRSAIHVCALLYTTGHCFNRLARVNEQLTAENWHNMHLLSNTCILISCQHILFLNQINAMEKPQQNMTDPM